MFFKAAAWQRWTLKQALRVALWLAGITTRLPIWRVRPCPLRACLDAASKQPCICMFHEMPAHWRKLLLYNA